MSILHQLGDALLMAVGMLWKVGWSLVLGFTLSAALQIAVSKESMQRILGKSGPKQIALATLFGAANSSCSYASASVSRTLLQKGAALTGGRICILPFWVNVIPTKVGIQLSTIVKARPWIPTFVGMTI